MHCVGMLAVTGTTGAITMNSGIAQGATVTHGGAGDWTVALNQQLDTLESVVVPVLNAAVAASGAVAFGVVQTDTTIAVTAVQEQGGGAASIRADVDFKLAMFSIH
jgi:hypothetical protein